MVKTDMPASSPQKILSLLVAVVIILVSAMSLFQFIYQKVTGKDL